jgi:glycosyltransferase involved in cell wall biosynthesis
VNTPPRIEVAQVVTRFIAGAGGVALRGALSLDPARYRVTIVTGEGHELLETARGAGMEVIVEPSLVSPLAPQQDRTALHRLTQILRAGDFDVVHTHSAKAGALGRVAAHRVGVPLIVHTYHGFPFHDFQSAVRRAAYVAIERRLARITDVVLAIGTGVATEALRRGLASPTSLRTVTPVVDGNTVPQTPQTRRAARMLLGIPDGVPVVGTVGRLDFQKAPDQFLAALRALRHTDAVGVWVGSGPDEAEVRRTVDRWRLADRVRLTGHRTDVAELLPAFDVFAMSSRYEGLPCAVVEAMRCGLPVVATAVNSVPDLVIPGETGLLVLPEQPESLALAVDSLLDQPALARQMAARGQALTGEAYDPSRLGGILDDVYSGVLREHVVALAG